MCGNLNMLNKQMKFPPIVSFLVCLSRRMDVFDFDSDTSSEFLGFGDNDIASDIDIEVSSVSSESSSSSDESELEFDEPNWRENNFEPVEIDAFTQHSGPNLPDDFDTSTSVAENYFQLFFTDDILRKIVRNSNRYAAYKIEEKKRHDPSYVNTTWYPVDLPELKAWIGLNIVFGCNKLPTSRSYWSSDPFIGNEGVKGVMTCKRFEHIGEHLHISDRDLLAIYEDEAREEGN